MLGGGGVEEGVRGRMRVRETDGVALVVGLVSRRGLGSNQLSAIPSDAFSGLTSLQQL